MTILIGCSVTILPVLPPGQAKTDTISNLQKRQQQTTKKLLQAQQKSQQLKRQASTVRIALAGTHQKITVTQTRLQVTQQQLTQARSTLTDLQHHLMQLETSHDQERAATMNRLRYLQRHSELQQWWLLLLTSQNFGELVDRQRQLARLVGHDRALILNLESRSRQVAQAHQAVVHQQQMITALNNQLLNQKTVYVKTANIQYGQLTTIEQQRQAYEAQQQQLEVDTNRLTGIIQRLITERQRHLRELEHQRKENIRLQKVRLQKLQQQRVRQERLARAEEQKQQQIALKPIPSSLPAPVRQPTPAPTLSPILEPAPEEIASLAPTEPDTSSVHGTGHFKMPIPGRMTSNFGWRMHPVYGVRRFHAGVDFGAAKGTAIGAADTGVVIYAGWYGGYGNAVVIDHGDGLATVYGHTSRILVNVGQAVQRGEKIAEVGSTGVSTGPHLHFEVRKDGKVVNPLSYLR